jgi:outer membrane lipopolysaccharide assembly protein LptE/RlpB
VSIHRLLLGTWAVAQVAGCGYKLIDYQESPPGLRSVSIRTFSNNSYEPGIEFVVADALRREFLRRGVVALVDDASEADLAIAGVVQPIGIRTRSFSSVALALEWEITLRLSVHAVRPDGSIVRVDEVSMQDTERYLASADIEATRKNRDEAMRRMAAVLAERIHDMLYEVAFR